LTHALALHATLPTGSASAWVKCPVPTSYGAVIEWGAAGDAGAATTPTAAVLAVSGLAPPPYSGNVRVLAGGATGTYIDATGTNAAFNQPRIMTVIPAGSTNPGTIVLMDQTNNCIRLIDPSSAAVTTFVGSCGAAQLFADGTGTNARFAIPSGVTFIPSASVVIVADGTGAAASFNTPAGVAYLATAGVLAVADRWNNRVRIVTYPGGVVTTLVGQGLTGIGQGGAFANGIGIAATLSGPYGIAALPNDAGLVVGDAGNNRIRFITYPGAVVTSVGSGTGAFADGAGTAASFNYPVGVVVSPQTGVVYVGDGYNYRIRAITPAGVVSTVAGSSAGVSGVVDGVGSNAQLSNPFCVGLTLDGRIIVARATPTAGSASSRCRPCCPPATRPGTTSR